MNFKHSDLCLLCQTSMISKALLNVCCSKYKSNIMLFKKPHGCNNLQMNMESVDTTLLESRIKMYSRAKVCQNLKTLLSVSCHNYPPCFQLFLGPEKLTTQKHLISYTSGKLITDINQNLLIVVLEMEKVCHFLSELIIKTKNMTTIGSWWQKQH